MPSSLPKKIWAIVPAAGIGSRMQSETPKQYLPLLDQTLIEVTLKKLLQLDVIEGIVLPLHAEDIFWPTTSLYNHPQIHCVDGGAERSDSVLAGLKFCQSQPMCENAWVLVHDAARPCVTIEKIEHLISIASTATDYDGAILAVPCADTVKRVEGHSISYTEDRSQLWLAHTPQFFPLPTLLSALEQALTEGKPITDEASAIEASGGKVNVVQDRRDNIKVTVPEDLLWAETLLKLQGFSK
ncbi:MAG: 2-C-methyl-D-erythritol 4-phosphate cytidylyltransferase [Agarilytica sp.]